MKLRAFLAFDIPDEVRKRLAAVVDDFSGKENRVKWIRPENMHVTMKFFGSVEEDLLLGSISEEIKEVVSGMGKAILDCRGVGVFPNWKYPRVVWAGFAGEVEKIIDLQKVIEEGLEKFDIKKDRRKFRLHLTLGRARGALKNSPLVKLVERLGPVEFGRVEINRLTLYKSLLTKNGAVYTSLREFGL